MLLLVYIVVWSIFVIITINKKSAPLYSFLISFYLIGMICAYVLFQFTGVFRSDSSNILSLQAIIYHLVYLICFFIPLKSIERNAYVHKLVHIRYKTLRPYVCLLIGLSFISIISSVSIIDGLRGMTINEIRTESMIDGVGRESKQSGSILSHITGIASEFSYISLLLSFYFMREYPKKKWIIYGLLVSCLAYLFYNLEIGGREALIRYCFDMLFIYVLFHSEISDVWLKKVKIIARVFLIVLLSFLAVVSAARFIVNMSLGGKFDWDSLLYGTLGYFSQGFVYFSKFFERFKNTNGIGENIFDPFIPGSPSKELFTSTVTNSDFSTNVFGTFVGSFVTDMGWIRALIPLVVLIIAMKMLSRRDCRSFFYYIYLFWFMRFAFSGIFYWIESFRNGARLYYFLIILMLDFLYTSLGRLYVRHNIRN